MYKIIFPKLPLLLFMYPSLFCSKWRCMAESIQLIQQIFFIDILCTSHCISHSILNRSFLLIKYTLWFYLCTSLSLHILPDLSFQYSNIFSSKVKVKVFPKWKMYWEFFQLNLSQAFASLNRCLMFWLTERSILVCLCRDL